MREVLEFPDRFLWGVAASSYQIEGAVDEDGRGESIWDRFCRTPGAVEHGDTGDVACDHYHRYRDDLDLMSTLGVGAYRFSISWPRIHPDGTSAVNAPGVAFYDRLVDAMLERGISPAATLYHWDLPQALQDRGGWTERATVDRFEEYARTMYDALGDRVAMWMTHNEPWMASFIAHLRGVHAPGWTDLQAALRAAHHLLLSHGRAVHAFRDAGASGEVGIVLNLLPTYPVNDTEEGREAAWGSDGYTNRWFLDPVLRGSYPSDTVERFERAGGRLDFVADDDLATIAEPVDFLGVNYYSPRRVGASGKEFGWHVAAAPAGAPTSMLGAEIRPDSLRDLLLRIRDDYGDVPLYVTENGLPAADRLSEDGAVHDPQRIEYVRGHLVAAHEALSCGVDLRGYFLWSFLDNFEWALGYGPRFGLTYVDYPTQRRVPKDSFAFYRDVVASNAVAPTSTVTTGSSR